VDQLGPNALDEVLEPGRVADCYLGLLLPPGFAGEPEAGTILIIAPAALLHPRVPQPGRAGWCCDLSRLHAADATLFRTGSKPVAPYATVILNVAGPARGSGGETAVLVGLVHGPNNYIVASFDAGADASHATVSVDVMVDGQRRCDGRRSAHPGWLGHVASAQREGLVEARRGPGSTPRGQLWSR
jgi:hypothetical protein